MGVLTGCRPRKEVLKGEVDDAIFAADFGDLIAGKAPKVYNDTNTFIQNTHPAKQLCKVAEVVFGRLADPKEGGATIRLSTGFGGGKPHTLMALWQPGSHKGITSENMRQADATEAAWWFGLMTRSNGKRALRALRILTEAVR